MKDEEGARDKTPAFVFPAVLSCEVNIQRNK